MKTSFAVAALTALVLTVGCNTDPEAAKKKYVERGNAYSAKGKYKEALIMYRNAIKKDPKYGEAYYQAALTELKMGTGMDAKFAAGRDLYRAVEFQPDNLDAYNRLIDIYLEAFVKDPRRPMIYITELKGIQDRLAKRHPESYVYLRLSGYLALSDGKLKDAVNYFTRAEKLKPNQPDVTMVMMSTLERDNQPQEAERIGKATLAKNPQNVAMYDALFMLYLKQQRTADAEKIVQDKVKAFPDDPEAVVQLASYYLASRKLEEMKKTLDTLLQDPKRFPQGYEKAGDFYLKTRNIDEAERVYRAGMDKFPDKKAEFLQRLIEVQTLRGNLTEANNLFQTLRKERPNDDATLAISATLRMLSGKKDELQGAIDDLQALVTRRPQDPVIRYNLGRAYMRKGNSQQAAIQFEEASKIKPEYIQPQVALADLLIGKKEFGRVLQITDEVLRADPTNIAARLIRTRALLGIGEFKTARSELEAMAKQDPNLLEARLQLAVLDNVTQNPKAAEANYRAIFEKTHDSRALIGLAESYVGQNRTDDAIKLISDEVQRDPSRSDYRIILGNLLVKVRRYDTAMTEFNTILQKDPKDADTWVRLGETKRLSGDTQGAVATFNKALEVSPNHISALLQLGMIYDAMGKYDQSRPLYQRVLKTDAENGVALNNMAYAMAETGGDLDAALNMAQHAKQRLPEQLDVLDTLGWIYMKKNLSDSAIQLFREIVRQEPNRSTFRYHLGMALAQKGNKVEAKKELDLALRSKPDREEEAKIKELLAKLG